MAYLAYGGVPGSTFDGAGMVPLEICDTLGYSRTPKLDGNKYLYTEHVLHVSGVFSPAATSYEIAGVGANPTFRERVAALTDVDVREWMMQPRRQLLYRVGRNTVIGSPRAGFDVDAAGGPFPLYCNVVRVAGWKAFIVHFGIRTCLYEAFKRTGAPPVVLSHQWKRERQVDQDGYSTLTTVGHAVFNAEVMFPQGVPGATIAMSRSPDDYFDTFAHPLERNFRRLSVNVSVAEDGTSCQYVIVDREMPINMVARGVSRVEAIHTIEITRPTFEQMTKGVVKVFEDVPLWGAAGAAAGSIFGPVGTAIGGIGGVGVKLGVNALGTASSIVPTLRHVIAVRAWGNRLTSKTRLQEACYEVINNRMAAAIDPRVKNLLGFQASLTWDLAGEFVTAQTSFETGIVARIFQLEGLGDILNVVPPMPQREIVGDVLDTAPQVNRGGLNDTATRGTYLGALLSQAMVAPADKSPVPPAARDRAVLFD